MQPQAHAQSGPRYRSIAADLRRQILTGKLRPGDRIETEKSLAAHYSVSVLTLRQAQSSLIAEGLIVKQQGMGTFVARGAAARRHVLFVCGLQRESGFGPSPYYMNSLRFCRRFAESAGLDFSWTWAEHLDRADPSWRDRPPGLDTIAGMLFIGCPEDHAWLVHARTHGLCHVALGKTAAAPRTIWFDPGQAAGLALGALLEKPAKRPRRLYVMSAPGTASGALRLIARKNLNAVHLPLPPSHGAWEYECRAYEAVRTLVAGGVGDDAFIFLDDVLARGGTRAILEGSRLTPGARAGTGARSRARSTPGALPRIAVVCGRQEVAPYGLPVTFIIHDTLAEARWAVQMLTDQLEQRPAGDHPRQSQFERFHLEQWEPIGSALAAESAAHLAASA